MGYEPRSKPSHRKLLSCSYLYVQLLMYLTANYKWFNLGIYLHIVCGHSLKILESSDSIGLYSYKGKEAKTNYENVDLFCPILVLLNKTFPICSSLQDCTLLYLHGRRATWRWCAMFTIVIDRRQHHLQSFTNAKSNLGKRKQKWDKQTINPTTKRIFKKLQICWVIYKIKWRKLTFNIVSITFSLYIAAS